MPCRISKRDAQRFRERWEVLREVERRELREMSPEEKLRQMAALMASASQLGWSDTLAEGEAGVRERWNRLKEAFRGPA
jgi:hypothetical protein